MRGLVEKEVYIFEKTDSTTVFANNIAPSRYGTFFDESKQLVFDRDFNKITLDNAAILEAPDTLVNPELVKLLHSSSSSSVYSSEFLTNNDDIIRVSLQKQEFSSENGYSSDIWIDDSSYHYVSKSNGTVSSGSGSGLSYPSFKGSSITEPVKGLSLNLSESGVTYRYKVYNNELYIARDSAKYTSTIYLYVTDYDDLNNIWSAISSITSRQPKFFFKELGIWKTYLNGEKVTLSTISSASSILNNLANKQEYDVTENVHIVTVYKVCKQTVTGINLSINQIDSVLYSETTGFSSYDNLIDSLNNYQESNFYYYAVKAPVQDNIEAMLLTKSALKAIINKLRGRDMSNITQEDRTTKVNLTRAGLIKLVDKIKDIINNAFNGKDSYTFTADTVNPENTPMFGTGAWSENDQQLFNTSKQLLKGMLTDFMGLTEIPNNEWIPVNGVVFGYSGNDNDIACAAAITDISFVENDLSTTTSCFRFKNGSVEKIIALGNSGNGCRSTLTFYPVSN